MTNSNFTDPGDPFSTADTKPANVCKHLGVKDDPQTFFYYASTWNHCHRPQSSVAVSPAHQSEFCLCDQHTRCPVFQVNWKGEFPKELLASSGSRRGSAAGSAAGSGAPKERPCKAKPAKDKPGNPHDYRMRGELYPHADTPREGPAR